MNKEIKTILSISLVIYASFYINTTDFDFINDFQNIINKNVEITEEKAISVGLSFAKLDKKFISPLENQIVTSNFGERIHPISNEISMHNGIDLYSFESDFVYAIYDGEITETSYSESFGNYIIIDHKNGYKSLYAHLSEVSSAQNVKKGDFIGIMGDTGTATSKHLHLEIFKNNKNIDPSDVINFYEN